MAYPTMNYEFDEEELTQFFTLTGSDYELLSHTRKPNTRLGYALLIKTHQFLGFPLEKKESIPDGVVQYIADQVNLPPAVFDQYAWGGRLWFLHLGKYREAKGIKPFSEGFIESLNQIVFKLGKMVYSPPKLMEKVIEALNTLKIEIPAQNRLHRYIGSAQNKLFEELFSQLTRSLSLDHKNTIERYLEVNDGSSQYDWLKACPGKLGMASLLEEIEKLHCVRLVDFKCPKLNEFSRQVLEELRDRAMSEDVSLMKRHPEIIKFGLMGVLLYFRNQEIIDGIVRLFIDLVRRIDKKAEKTLEKKIIKQIKTIYGKKEKLYKIAKAATANPKGTIDTVLFRVVDEDSLHRIIEEFEAGSENNYEVAKAKEMRKKYSSHYRKMLRPVLNALEFRVNNAAFENTLKGLEIIKQLMDSKDSLYPHSIEIPDKLITGHWKNGNRVTLIPFTPVHLTKKA